MRRFCACPAAVSLDAMKRTIPMVLPVDQTFNIGKILDAPV